MYVCVYIYIYIYNSYNSNNHNNRKQTITATAESKQSSLQSYLPSHLTSITYQSYTSYQHLPSHLTIASYYIISQLHRILLYYLTATSHLTNTHLCVCRMRARCDRALIARGTAEGVCARGKSRRLLSYIYIYIHNTYHMYMCIYVYLSLSIYIYICTYHI